MSDTNYALERVLKFLTAWNRVSGYYRIADVYEVWDGVSEDSHGGLYVLSHPDLSAVTNELQRLRAGRAGWRSIADAEEVKAELAQAQQRIAELEAQVKEQYAQLAASDEPCDEPCDEVDQLRKQVRDITHIVSHMLPAHDEPGVPDPGDHWRRVHHELVTEVAWIISPQHFSERERRIRETRATTPTESDSAR